MFTLQGAAAKLVPVLSVASSAIQVIDFGVRFLMQVKQRWQFPEIEIEDFSAIRREAQLLCRLNTILIEALNS